MCNLCIKGIFTSKLVNNYENLPLLTNYIECNDNYEDKQYNNNKKQYNNNKF